MFPCGRRHLNQIAAAAVLCVQAFGPFPLMAQPMDGADGVTFEERFSVNAGELPTFIRPEVMELFSVLPLGSEDVASGGMASEPFESGPLHQMIVAEPKGAAKVLKDLLTTPVQELLVSRAEAGPDVPPPPAPDEVASVSPSADAAPAETASVPARSPDPLSERPAGDEVVSATISVAAPEQERERSVSREVVSPTEPSRNEQIATGVTAGRNGNLQGGRRIAGGRAAWYQHPGRTASGERFNPDQLTAAHHTLPFGTRIRVVNKANGRSVVVRINDRIPRKAKFIIDLSRASAKAIGISGLSPVVLYQLDGSPEAPQIQSTLKQTPAGQRTAAKR